MMSRSPIQGVLPNVYACLSAFHGLRPLACSYSKLISDTLKHFRQFGGIRWVIGPSQYLHLWRNREKFVYASMPRASFETAIPVFGRFNRIRSKPSGHWDRHFYTFLTRCYSSLVTSSRQKDRVQWRSLLNTRMNLRVP